MVVYRDGEFVYTTVFYDKSAQGDFSISDKGYRTCYMANRASVHGHPVEDVSISGPATLCRAINDLLLGETEYELTQGDWLAMLPEMSREKARASADIVLRANNKFTLVSVIQNYETEKHSWSANIRDLKKSSMPFYLHGSEVFQNAYDTLVRAASESGVINMPPVVLMQVMLNQSGYPEDKVYIFRDGKSRKAQLEPPDRVSGYLRFAAAHPGKFTTLN